MPNQYLNHRRRSTLLLLILQSIACWSFFQHHHCGTLSLLVRKHNDNRRALQAISEPSSFSVPSSQLDSDLSPDEKTTVNIFRKYGPSVAFVTSVAFMTSDEGSSHRNRPQLTKYDNLPRGGMGLGSGSAFTVTDDGYLLTNYHVIERAYRIIQNRQRVQDSIASLLQNVSTFVSPFFMKNQTHSWFQEAINTTQSIFYSTVPIARVDAKIYIRINSSTRFNECRLVDVVPELDMAVLKMMEDRSSSDTSNTTLSLNPLPLGSSSNLLVGQRLIAIGNVRVI